MQFGVDGTLVVGVGTERESRGTWSAARVDGDRLTVVRSQRTVVYQRN